MFRRGSEAFHPDRREQRFFALHDGAEHLNRALIGAQDHSSGIHQQRGPASIFQRKNNFRLHRRDNIRTKFQGTLTKAAGNNSFTVNSRIAVSFRLSAMNTFASGAYSASSCRHAPHGIGPPGARATTATATKFFFPPVSALNSATRSAQQVSP